MSIQNDPFTRFCQGSLLLVVQQSDKKFSGVKSEQPFKIAY